MSNITNFKCREATAVADIVITIDGAVSCPRQMQFVCVSGTIEIKGEDGAMFGNSLLVPNAIIITDTQAFNFNEGQYKFLEITIKAGTDYQIITGMVLLLIFHRTTKSLETFYQIIH